MNAREEWLKRKEERRKTMEAKQVSPVDSDMEPTIEAYVSIDDSVAIDSAMPESNPIPSPTHSPSPQPETTQALPPHQSPTSPKPSLAQPTPPQAFDLNSSPSPSPSPTPQPPRPQCLAMVPLEVVSNVTRRGVEL